MRPLFRGAKMGSPQRMRFKGKLVGLWVHHGPRWGEWLSYLRSRGEASCPVPVPGIQVGLGTRDHQEGAVGWERVTKSGW